MTRATAWWFVLAPTVTFASSAAVTRSEKVQLTIATLHAAALTTSRTAGDSSDTPFFVVSVVGPKANATSMLPLDAVRNIPLDGALGARPLTELTLADGDSIQVLVSVLENAKIARSDEARVAAVPARGRSHSESEQVEHAKGIVAPLVKDGAHWLGSVSLLLINEAGAVSWRRLDCVASCRVLTGPAATALQSGAQPASGVVELTGSGGTYHLALRANRAP